MQKIVLILGGIISLVMADRVVMTNNGPVQGVTIWEGEPKIEAFMGIPYAEPPIGRLRFRKPVQKSPWSGVYDASQQPPACIQNITGLYFEPDPENMSEDCLYLSLWVPYSKEPSELKPVMFFTHGGAFNLGSGNMPLYDGTNLAKFGDVVVVNFNYRVGAFGFFLAFIEDADGNMGLYDQALALKWIHANIKFFGGDPDQIVVFGESAGAMSTGGHLISPVTRGLFKRVILQSGAPTFTIILDDNANLYETSQKFATLVGCADKSVTLKDNPSLIVQCLTRLPAEELTRAEGLMKQLNPITFYPRTGDTFLPKPAIDLLKEGYFQDTELMIGVNELEGTFFLSVALPQYFGIHGQNRIQNVPRRLAYQMTRLFFKNLGQKNENALAEFYINSVQNGTADIYIEQMAKGIGDLLITCDSVFQAEYISMRNPVYYYVFTRRPSSTPLADWMKTTHFDELQYVFGNPLFGNFTAEEIALSKKIMSRWIAFAKTGNPNVDGLITWPTFTGKQPEYLSIDDEESVHMRPDNYRCEFWRDRFQADISNEIVSKIKRSVAKSGGILLVSNVFLVVFPVALSSFKWFGI